MPDEVDISLRRVNLFSARSLALASHAVVDAYELAATYRYRPSY